MAGESRSTQKPVPTSPYHKFHVDCTGIEPRTPR